MSLLPELSLLLAALGTAGLGTGCAVAALLAAELEKLADGGITPTELERSRGQLSGGLVLGLEDSGSRMSRLGKAELVHGELQSLEEALERMRSVTAEDVQTLAKELASRDRTIVRVGPFGKRDDAQQIKEKLDGAAVDSALVRAPR